MAILAVVWAALVAYELIAPREQAFRLAAVGNVIWALFGLELLVKLIISGHPFRFLRRHWPSVLFLVLPVLRVLRVTRALRVVRVLPASRVVGSSYRAVGTARGLLTGRLQFLLVTTAVVVFGGGQLLFVLERGREGALTSLGDALWWRSRRPSEPSSSSPGRNERVPKPRTRTRPSHQGRTDTRWRARMYGGKALTYRTSTKSVRGERYSEPW